MAKRINKVTLLQRHLNRLPKTKEFLHDNIESLDEFQLRRVRWAIKELTTEGGINEWNVIIKAGLGKNFYDKLKEKIRKIM